MAIRDEKEFKRSKASRFPNAMGKIWNEINAKNRNFRNFAQLTLALNRITVFCTSYMYVI